MIEYRFLFEAGQELGFTVDPDRRYAGAGLGQVHADWTRLEFHRCDHCPLQTSEWPCCPVALDLEPIAAVFSDVVSHSRVRVQVTTPERGYVKDCDVQTALRSLLGVIMATSACPILAEFRGLAASHLPFATLEETLFRTAGAYLLKQYFVRQGGGVPDLELKGLKAFYAEVQTVNRCFKQRLDVACSQDANLNALGSLFYVSVGVSYSLEDRLDELKPRFCPQGWFDWASSQT